MVKDRALMAEEEKREEQCIGDKEAEERGEQGKGEQQTITDAENSLLKNVDYLWNKITINSIIQK